MNKMDSLATNSNTPGFIEDPLVRHKLGLALVVVTHDHPHGLVEVEHAHRPGHVHIRRVPRPTRRQNALLENTNNKHFFYGN
jgi:hypothetical protein